MTRARPAAAVVVVSSNAETLDGMHEYFRQTGVTSSSKSQLNALPELAGCVRALVVFPDDFPRHEASAYLSGLGSRRPDLTMVIVTRDPTAYRAMTSTSGARLSAIVLPRPAFGWSILDAVRTTLGAQSDD